VKSEFMRASFSLDRRELIQKGGLVLKLEFMVEVMVVVVVGGGALGLLGAVCCVGDWAFV